MVSAPFLIWLSGPIGRICGDDYDLAFNSRITDKLTAGWIIAGLTGHFFDIYTPFIMAAVYGNLSCGWGPAIGAAIRGETPRFDMDHRDGKRHWWLKGFLKDNAWLALIARGLVSGIYFIPLYYFDWRLVWVPISFMVAFPVGVLLGKLMGYLFASKMDFEQRVQWIWKQQELCRYWVSSTIIFMGYLWV